MRGTIYVTADHSGWAQKKRLVAWLTKAGHHVVDIGPAEREPGDDYPIWAARAARLVTRDSGSRAIMLCWSGVGMAIVANKMAGIRAVQGWNVPVVKRSRQDEDTNVLSFASGQQSFSQVTAMTKVWLQTKFSPKKRYQRRLREIRRIEHAG